ncbi:flavodoxin family protein [Tahibacter amnicola]|uniref:Flavodoxin-like domain-containing protein n=1 Tax=Tahibacter amnicola TaxID=2976241 RepID=A0ABY6BK02_9GAMM|nr:flavodoxin [Tahibacter amnicola]UXI69410.1 hypothetical protein N4264_07105 [Tahibacter amnicola]
MADILVVYFSRSGATRHVAEDLARRLEADCVPIEPLVPYRGFFGLVRALYHAVRQMAAPIAEVTAPLPDYQLVVIGTPVWAGHVSPPVRQFLRDHGHRCQRTAIFCTLIGSGAAQAFADMRALIPAPPLATLAINASTLHSDLHLVSAGQFVTTIHQQQHQWPASTTPQ